MKTKLSTRERVQLENLRAQVIAARRWCHCNIQNLDALWNGFPGKIAGLPPSQRAIRLELARRQLATLTASIPESVFLPKADLPAPAAASDDTGDPLVT